MSAPSDRLRVAVLMGGPSSEREISLRSGEAVMNALHGGPFEALPVRLERDGRWLLPAGDAPRALAAGPGEPASPVEALVPATPETLRRVLDVRSVDCLVLALHGRFGEDGTLQGLLDAAGVAYTGSGVLASALCMDKGRARAVAAAAGLAVAPGAVVDPERWNRDAGAVLDELESRPGYPAFVKPAGGGSSIGAGPADDREALRARIAEVVDVHGDRALVERRIAGRELSCPVLGNATGPVRALPVVEIVPVGGAWFDFSAKYVPGACEEICPARLTEDEERLVREAAVTAHRAMGCEGMSRSDFILEGEVPWYLETNTIPGMTAGSLCPRSARADGIEFPELVALLVEMALERHARRRTRGGPEEDVVGR